MILITSAWYNEPEYYFEISHKVDNFIREQVIKTIFPKYQLDDIEPNWYLKLSVSTASDIKELEVRGPEINKRSKMISYGFWMPFDTITKSKDPINSYLDYYFQALQVVFTGYGVDPNDFNAIKDVCVKEIVNNSEYIYEED